MKVGNSREYSYYCPDKKVWEETGLKVGNSREYSYYCPDKKVWEETGYFNKNM